MRGAPGSRAAELRVPVTATIPIGMLRAACFALVCTAAACGSDVVVGALADGGAGPSCETVCAKITVACPGPTMGCASNCAPFAALQMAGACPAEVDGFLACLDQSPSAFCAPSASVCATEIGALSDCSTRYCGTHPLACAQ
jgi:hypothetical protein